ncbi:MAG: acetyl-CoA hydrolase/transferase family protein [Calditrichaeota bacterium]|nr:acetyl-CoA hydrolase/transferase family protein [Candidatus Cloacimonadota bacterium]MCB1047366.1 acetyl-CoA hydrolase/transferase family protein [Calditrichota bacterium]MCB9472647.1 acetyl-CoA hydrolase/transferase family protein [Candidatus Delongbacteria bacterium]
MAPYKANSPEEVVASIESNEYVWVHSMGATPVRLLEGIANHARDKQNITLMMLHTEGAEVVTGPELEGHIQLRCFFVGAPTRKIVNEGRADYIPMFLSEIPKYFRAGEQRVDTVLLQVSPPDAHGMCTMGISVEAAKAACDVARKIIAHINPSMPRTHGDAFIPYNRFHAVYEENIPLPEFPAARQSETTLAIGERVASLIRDGDCLQMGIGAIPDAALKCLGDHKDIGIHTEMFAEGLLDLVERGVVTGKRKKIHPGKIVTSFAMGTRRLYDFVDDNPEVVFLDVEYVNDSANIRRNPNVTAINSALQVDLSGQVCADSIGTRIYSGVGGQMDFIRGATLSPGGRAIIALPSTAAGGKVSRIAPMLAPGSGVVTTRAHVQYVVTEYGVANLKGRSLRERARELIRISHPDFREELEKQAREFWGLHI